MTNFVNKISYAVEIQTSYSGVSIPEIGMDSSGKILYVTDNLDTSSGYIYEGGATVTDTYSRDFLVKGGIKSSSQKIDIITGGDYAFLGSLDISIANFEELHLKILKTDDLYLVGASMTMYVIIDDTFYKRWGGVVSETKFNDESFTIQGKDKHNSDNNTVKDTVFGYSDTSFVAVVRDQNAFIPDQTIKASDFGSNTLSNYNYANPDTSNDLSGAEDTESVSNKYFNCVAHRASYITTHNHGNGFTFHLNGWKGAVSTGMLVTFNKGNIYYTIRNVYKVTDLKEDGTTPAYATAITIDEVPDDIVDYTQFYGLQPWDVRLDPTATDILQETEVFLEGSQGKIVVDVWDEIFSFPIPAGSEWITDSDGKYLGTDSDGNDVSFTGVLDSDGNLQISNSTSYDIKTATNVKHVTISPSNYTLLENGALRNIQNLPTTSISISNDIQMDGKFSKTKMASAHGLRFTMDDIDGYTPMMLINNMVYADEAWNDLKFFTELGGGPFERPAVMYGSDYTPVIGEMDAPTSMLWDKIATDEELLKNKIFSQYEVSVYKIFKNEDWGEVPELLGSFTLPNYTHVISKRFDTYYDYSESGGTYAGDLKYHVTLKGASSTNIPVSEINSDNIAGESTGEKICITSKNQRNWKEAGATYEYPDGTVDHVAYDSELIATNDYLYVITSSYASPSSDDNGSVDITTKDLSGSIGNGTNNYGMDKASFSFGINTIGSYKATAIDSVSDITLKTHNIENDDYASTIKDLSGSASTLRSVNGEVNRNEWATGNQIADEVNTFNLVTSLCKQGFVGGFTDRKGDVILKEFLQDNDDESILPVLHDNELFKRSSLKSFQLSTIAKCYNEFTVKYHYSGGGYKKELGVYKVDEDEFPEESKYEYELYPENGSGEFSFKVFRDSVTGTDAFTIDPISGTAAWNRLPPIGGQVRFASNEAGSGIFTGVYHGREQLGNPLFTEATYEDDFNTWYNGYMQNILYSKTTISTWETFVSGVPDYSESKDLWEKAHQSWLINQRIRKAPSERTDLKWCVDLEEFGTITSGYPFFESYQWEYLSQLVDWTTRQKFSVEYSLPITPDTVTLDLLQKTEFSDAILTPDVVGKGWLTSILCETKSDTMKVVLTFEPDFMSPAGTIIVDNDIWEQPSSVTGITDIIEDPANTLDITEIGNQ